VAGQAHLRALICGHLCKAYYILSLALGLQVLAARTVTGFAAPLHAFQLSGIQAVMNGLFKLLIHVVMARDTRVSTNIKCAIYQGQFLPVFASFQKTLAAESAESAQYAYE
jgi:hypothetical protein